MSTSKLQEQTKERLRVLLNQYQVIENARLDWLKNPETGYPLELDFWLPDLKVGIEVQGIQHIRFTPHFHTTVADFEAQVRRDQFKRETCQATGVFFYEVFRVEDIEDFIDASGDHCQEMRRELYKKNCAIKATSYYAARIVRETSKGRQRNQQSIEGWKSDILHICAKYNIPVESIRPDFKITKLQLAYFEKPQLEIQRIRDDGKTSRYPGILMIVQEDGLIKARCLYDSRGSVYDDLCFDPANNWQATTNKNGYTWRITPRTLPENLRPA